MSQELFFSKTISNRIEALPQDLRELRLFKPFYTLELLEDIAQFRGLPFSEKSGHEARMLEFSLNENFVYLLDDDTP